MRVILVRFGIHFLLLFWPFVCCAQNIPGNSLAGLLFSPVNQPSLAGIGGVAAILEDSEGFLWLGGESGLARFDGYQLKEYRHDAERAGSLSNHFITGLQLDSQKQLWVATGKGLNRYNPVTQTFTHFNTQSSINFIYQDSSGTLWAGFAEGGLYRYVGAEQRFERFNFAAAASEYSNDSFFTAFEDNNGDLWLGHRQGALRVNRHSAAAWHYSLANENGSSQPIKVIYQDSNGVLWFGSTTGLLRFNPASKTLDNYHAAAKPEQALVQVAISAITEDADGRLWLASDGAGLFYKDLKSEYFSAYSPAGLVNRHTRALLQSRAGDLWVGHYPAGLSRLHQSSIFHHYVQGPDGQGLSNHDILSVAEDVLGQLWVGTEGGLNRININTHAIAQLHSAQGVAPLPKPVIALGTNASHVFMGTWPAGLSRAPLQGSELVPYKGPQEMIAPAFIFVDSRQRTWVGLQAGLVLLAAGENWQQGRQLSAKAALSIVEARDGSFWVGEYGRLMQLNANGELIKSYHFSADNPAGLPDAAILAMVEDAEQNLWLATRAGVVLFNPAAQTFTRYSQADGLPSDSVNCVVEEDAQWLWFATEAGLARLNRDTGVFNQFTRKDGLAGNRYKSKTCLRLSNGELVFGSTQGLTRFNPKRLSSEQIFPAVTLTSFEVLSQGQHLNWPLPQALAQAQSVTLPYPHSAFALTFSALNFAPQEQQYAYYLKGLEHDWTFVGTSNRATYTNLPPGQYVFRVQAASAQGAWAGEGRELVIIIGAPWWAAGWLRGMLLVLLCVLGYGAWRVRKSVQKAPEQLLGEQNEPPALDPKKVAQVLPKIMAGMEQDQLFLDHSLSLKSFAKHIGVNARDVSKVLNSHMHCTFLEFVSRYRVAEAKRLLLADSDNSVTDIMLKSGFNTKSAFYRVFKAECGITPSEYRAGAAKPPR